MDDAPLAGVQVIEAGNYMSVPFAAMMLADLGASVVKVEPPHGDPFRRFGRPAGAVASIFVNTNRGKRSIALDLKDREQRSVFEALVGRSDVLLSNWRPGVADRLGVGDEQLATINPRLLRVYVSGYGSSGPDAGQPAYDSVIQARSAMAWAQGPAGQPQLAVGYLVDKLTAAMAVQVTLAALYERTRSGKGDAIEVPMLDVAAYLDFPDLFAFRTFVDSAPDDSRNRQMSANRPVAARDGWLVMAAVSRDQIQRALAAFDDLAFLDELLVERDGAALTARFIARIETHTRSRTVDHCLARFHQHDVPAARCLDPDEHLADAQVAHNALYEIVEHPQLGRVRQVRYPATSARWGRLRSAIPAPALDADRAALIDLTGDDHSTPT